jgi:ribose transport system permease protein
MGWRPATAGRQLLGRAWGLNQIGLLLSLILICVVFGFLSPYFLLPMNGVNVARASSYMGITAAITTLVLVGGALDLSIGAVMALSSVVVAQLLIQGVPWPMAVAGSLGAGLLVGLLNGVVVTYVGINPLIVTIATQFLVRGVAYIIVSGRELAITDSHVLFIGQGDVFGLPFPALLMLAIFGLVAWWMNFTAFGKHVFAIGGSPNGLMAKLAGIAVERRRMQLYILSAVFASVSGLVLGGFTAAGLAYAASGIELTVISAVILGGTALIGGRGSVGGTLMGVFLLGIIANGMTLLSVPSYWQFVVQGAILLAAVVIDELRLKRALQ